MGSEQSTSAGTAQWSQRSVSTTSEGRVNQLRRGKSLVERSEITGEDQDDSPDSRPGNTSPGPSICSDSDLPYISYTVSRPIGGKYYDSTLSDDIVCMFNFFSKKLITHHIFSLQILQNFQTNNSCSVVGHLEVPFQIYPMLVPTRIDTPPEVSFPAVLTNGVIKHKDPIALLLLKLLRIL